MASTVAEAWPSVANTLTAPWRSTATRSIRRAAQPKAVTDSLSIDRGEVNPPSASLTDFLRNRTTSSLQPVLSSPSAARADSDSPLMVTGLTQVGIRAVNPLSRQHVSRSQGLPGKLYWQPLLANRAPYSPMAIQQHRRFGTTSGSSNGVSHNQLAAVEENANRNAGNANMQNAFYQLLLRANLPGVLIERYESGRFASNAATEATYRKALVAIKARMMPASRLSGKAQDAWKQGYAHGEREAHALASMNANAPHNALYGGRDEPVHVVVQESRWTLLYRWIRFLVTFGLIGYLCLSLATFGVEALTALRRAGSLGGKSESEVTYENQTTRFSDVHGCDEAKDELQEVVEFLKSPEKFSDLGAKLPKGVLLIGPPGTGKTLLARAVAGEAGVPFYYMSGSEFDEIFVGVGAKRVRELFAAAKSKSPAIIFIDELDAIGGKRNARDQAHAKQTLNQLLTELDGFDQDSKIVIMGATNLPNLLDKALTRPGRFDRHVNVDLPDVRGRLAILKHYASKIKAAPDVDLEAIAARSAGKSGAELENMLNVAALRASRAKAKIISKEDLDWAFDRVTMGSARKSMVVTEKEKEMTAYHEAGHALVQLFEKDSSSLLYKVTILPQGPALGHTANLPAMDKYSYTAAEYMSNIRVLLGGKMAEEMVYGDDKVTSGVSSDLEKATDLSFMMVTNFGMSSALGPVEYGRRYENLSSETRSKIEQEVQKNLMHSYEQVRTLLTEKRKELDLLAQALVRYETLNKMEVEMVIRGESLPGRIIMPKGPMILPVPDAPHPPGLGTASHPQPTESEAPPSVQARALAAADSLRASDGICRP
ncbi:hypothetical protein E4U17_006421 [Claviceps sp. LM77 group G4]|nr:hypothetical protein E4U17_006421 [Claviceps sp. LM77 group G4]KAG6069956.1 hypothetical protein E4U33_004497 [Claviceps sp. LM78 group G4]KAG6078913.1 hypothetical protein E4U16_001377 [Claviceps sp. LM84 group G4]